MRTAHPESGNVIFFILLAIVLIGLVTAALRSGGIDDANIDRETVAVRAAEIRQYASELERATVFILSGNHSEQDLRFAHPDAPPEYGNDYSADEPRRQVFAPEGGGAEYRLPPQDILTDPDGNPATSPDADDIRWEFYGRTHIPGIGSEGGGTEKAELTAVLPFVTAEFCTKINIINGLDGQPADTGGGAATVNCIDSGSTMRFTSGATYSDPPNTVDDTTFSTKPAMEGCVECDGGSLHFYHVLHAR